jgi:hypothetical protein
MQWQPVPPSNCPLTVRFVLRPKKSSLKFIDPSSFFGGFSNGRVVTLNISPAPSASLAVMMAYACKQSLYH